MPNTYCTLEDVYGVLADVDVPEQYDIVLTALISRASRLIDSVCKRDPGDFCTGTAGTTRFFQGQPNSTCLWVDPIADPTAMIVQVSETGSLTDYDTWASTDFIVWPYNRRPVRRLDLDILNGNHSYWPQFPKSVKITAPFGMYTTTPEDVTQAAIVQTVRWFQRGKQGFKDVGAIVELGQLKYVKKLDPDVELILIDGGYMRTVI